MPGPIYFYSDESGTHTGGRYIVVAGVALDAHHHASREMLRSAEAKSKKGTLDWHSTKRREVKREYLRLALIESDLFYGRIFYRVFEGVGDTWGCTVAALADALRLFANEREAVVIHQGFTVATRDRLKEHLERIRVGSARQVLEVRKAKATEPLVRLADSLAGLTALMRFGSNLAAGYFDSVFPEWFVDLKNESPPPGEGG